MPHWWGKAALWCFSYHLENKSKNPLWNISFLLNSWFKLPRRLIEHFVSKAKKKKKKFKAFVCVGPLFIKSDFLALYHPGIHLVHILFLLDGFRRNDGLYLSFKSISDLPRSAPSQLTFKSPQKTPFFIGFYISLSGAFLLFIRFTVVY